MTSIANWGDLKKFAEENGITDDTPIWISETTDEGGCSYPRGTYRTYHPEAYTATEEFGLALPKERRRTETGLVLM